MKLKKILVGSLVASMIFSNSMIGFAEAPTSESVFNDLLVKFDALLDDKTNVAMDVYYLVERLQDANIREEMQTQYDALSDSDKATLANYDVTVDSIKAVYDGMIDLLPTSLNDLKNDDENIFARLYDDTNIQYSNYEDDLTEIGYDFYELLPAAVKTELNKFNKDGTVNNKLVYIHILDTILDDKFGSAVWNQSSGTYTNTSFGFETTTRDDIVAVLNTYKNSDVEAENIETLAGVFFNMSNTVVDSMVNVVEDIADTTSDDGKNEFTMIISLLKRANFITVTNASTNTGGGGGGKTNPSTDNGLSDDAQESLEEIDDLVPEAGTVATPAQQTAAALAVEKLLDDLDLTQAKNANVQLNAVAASVGNTLSFLSDEQATKVAGQFIDNMEVALANENVSAKDKVAMVENAINNTFGKLLTNKQVDASDLVGIKSSIATIVEESIASLASVELSAETDDEAKADVKSFNVTAKGISVAIAKAKNPIANLAKALTANGFEDVAESFEARLNINLPELKENEQVDLTLDVAAVGSLKDAHLGVTVEAKGLVFNIPSSLFDASKEVTVKTNAITETLSTETSAGTVENLSTLDVTVASGADKVENAIELAFDLEDVDADLDALMVGVYENGEWTKLDYTVENGKVVFTAPHFSVYSLMSYAPSFKDVDSSWAKKYITSLSAKGVINGKSDEAFDPDATLTRAEFATLIVKALDINDEVNANFKDVKEDDWFYTYVGLVGANSLASGTTNGEFRPNDPITREDMAVMIYRAYNYKYGFNLKNAASPFSDDSAIANKEAVYAVKTSGIISGYSDNTFKPADCATRAEAATMMYLFLQK